jgi:hypothetical protein
MKKRVEVSKKDVVQKKGTISSLKSQKDGKIRLELQTDSGMELFVLDWKTMIYQLTERNAKSFETEDRLEDTVKAINTYRQRIKELDKREIQIGSAIVSTHKTRSPAIQKTTDRYRQTQLQNLKEAYDRLRTFGPHIRLASQMKVYVFANRKADETYAVLVKTVPPPKKSKKS